MKLHLTWLVLAAAMLPAARSAKPEPAKTASTQEPDPFIGNAMCLRCHQDVQQALTANPHGSGAAPDVVDNGCQSCHGPGRTHVQSPNNNNTQPSVDRMTSEQQNQLCTGCHTELPAFSTAHQVAKISCSGCHVLHERTADMGVQRWQPNCLSCHSGSKAFDELHEYDIVAMENGTVACRSCHKQAHGS